MNAGFTAFQVLFSNENSRRRPRERQPWRPSMAWSATSRACRVPGRVNPVPTRRGPVTGKSWRTMRSVKLKVGMKQDFMGGLFFVKLNGDMETLGCFLLFVFVQAYYCGMMIPPSGTDGWSWKDQDICLVGIMHCDFSPFGNRFFSRARMEHDFFFWILQCWTSSKSFCK